MRRGAQSKYATWRGLFAGLLVAGAGLPVACALDNALAQGAGVGVQSKGEFHGRLVSEWLSDGTRMKLIEPFEFIDSKSRRWSVPGGVVVDGASIPQVFWSLIGAPFSGIYRNASVIHDYYCDTRSRPHQDVHQVFYEAMRTAGVSEQKAWLMYKAVEHFGPRWETQKVDPRCAEGSATFDFEHCAQAARRPVVKRPQIGRTELEKFYEAVKKDADPRDLKTLETEIKAH